MLTPTKATAPMIEAWAAFLPSIIFNLVLYHSSVEVEGHTLYMVIALRVAKSRSLLSPSAARPPHAAD